MSIKHLLQSLAQRFKPPQDLRRAGEIENELTAARQERQHLLERLTGLRVDTDRELSASLQEQHHLQEQLAELQASTGRELSTTNTGLQALHRELVEMKGDLERGLSARDEGQRNLLTQLAGLQAGFEREVAAANLEKEVLRGQVTALRVDLEHLRTRDEQLRVELQQHFDQLRIGREAANGRIEALSSSLADAVSRQEETETRVSVLENRLQDQQQAHQASMREMLVRERRQARRLIVATMLAAAAFVLGIAGSVINFREVQNTSRLLSGVSLGIRDIRSTMETLSGANTRAPGMVTPSGTSDEPGHEKPTPSGPVPATGVSREPSDTKAGLSGQKLPVPEFAVSGSRPLDDQTFRSRGKQGSVTPLP